MMLDLSVLELSSSNKIFDISQKDPVIISFTLGVALSTPSIAILKSPPELKTNDDENSQNSYYGVYLSKDKHISKDDLLLTVEINTMEISNRLW